MSCSCCHNDFIPKITRTFMSNVCHSYKYLEKLLFLSFNMIRCKIDRIPKSEHAKCLANKWLVLIILLYTFELHKRTTGRYQTLYRLIAKQMFYFKSIAAHVF